MGILIIIAIVAAVIFFIYCGNVGKQMEEYQNRKPEWNPPLPSFPPIPDQIPRKSGCCCAKCKYLYTGTKTEYWYDDNELKGKSETTQYRNWCLIHNADVEREVGYRLSELHHCGMYEQKNNSQNKK